MHDHCGPRGGRRGERKKEREREREIKRRKEKEKRERERDTYTLQVLFYEISVVLLVMGGAGFFAYYASESSLPPSFLSAISWFHRRITT